MAEPLEMRALGATGLSVTRLGIGCAPLGNLFAPLGPDDARQTLSAAWGSGLRFFDTAPLYGYGLSEERLGSFLCEKPRAGFVLATKVGRLVDVADVSESKRVDIFKNVGSRQARFDFSYDATMRSLEESLSRLGVERVDILHVHDPDDCFPEVMSGAYVALERLRSEGVIRAIGVGMNQVDMLCRFAREGAFDCFLLAGRYSLLDHAHVHELLTVCSEFDVALIIGGVYNSGILADQSRTAMYEYRRAPVEIVKRAQAIRDVCSRYEVPLKAAAIQFPLGSPVVASVLSGVRSIEELSENLRMFEYAIPAELWDDLRAEGFIADDVPTPSPTSGR